MASAIKLLSNNGMIALTAIKNRQDLPTVWRMALAKKRLVTNDGNSDEATTALKVKRESPANRW